MTKLLGFDQLPDILPKLLEQAVDSRNNLERDYSGLVEKFDPEFQEVKQLYQANDILKLASKYQSYFQLKEEFDKVRSKTGKIAKFITDMNKTNSIIGPISTRKKLEGLARLSILQSTLWKFENELIQRYCKED